MYKIFTYDCWQIIYKYFTYTNPIFVRHQLQIPLRLDEPEPRLIYIRLDRRTLFQITLQFTFPDQEVPQTLCNTRTSPPKPSPASPTVIPIFLLQLLGQLYDLVPVALFPAPLYLHLDSRRYWFRAACHLLEKCAAPFESRMTDDITSKRRRPFRLELS